jgi:hypothetical protein
MSDPVPPALPAAADAACNALVAAAIAWAPYLDQWDKFRFQTDHGPVYVSISRDDPYPDSFDEIGRLLGGPPTITLPASDIHRALQALNDWTATYASELCAEEDVQAARERIKCGGGTLAYVCDALTPLAAAIRQVMEIATDAK